MRQKTFENIVGKGDNAGNHINVFVRIVNLSPADVSNLKEFKRCCLKKIKQKVSDTIRPNVSVQSHLDI